MKKYNLLLGALLLFPNLVFAGRGVEVTIEKAKMDEYINFIMKFTTLKYNGQPLPKIKQVEQDLVQIFAYGDQKVAEAEGKGITLMTVNAIYLADDKTIYISDKLDLSDPKTEPSLVHEMVHYLQDVSGYTASLDGHISCTESWAYDVQVLWQTFNNIDTETILFYHEMSVLTATQCLGDQFRFLFSKPNSENEGYQ